MISKVPMKILLVDDNPDNRMLVISYLKEHPYAIDIADDGTTALEKFFNNKYDLVLMDVRMKIMNGYEATRKIREWEKNQNHPLTPVLALTAYAMKKDVDEALESGCNGHLSKPIRRKDLLHAILDYAPGKSADVVDRSSEAMVVEMDRELIAQLSDLVPDFLKNREGDLVKLRDSLSVNDFETIETVGHNMAGTAPGYGFTEMGTIGEKLEDAAIEKDREQIEEQTEQLAKVLQFVKKELKQELAA